MIDGYSLQTYPLGITSPSGMAVAPDGRLFVLQQSGQVRVVKNGQLASQPFTTVDTTMVWERGLIGIALDPSFESDGYVFIYYTVTDASTGVAHNRVARVTAPIDPTTGQPADVATVGSQVTILDLPDLTDQQGHNGGGMAFGADGKLYLGVGDNGQGALATSINYVFGKILRMNPDGSAPIDNPFYNQGTGITQYIYQKGLRNPFTIAFQPGTSNLYINDVGESSWEEVDTGPAGADFGWNSTEGATTDPQYVTPVYTYPHPEGICTIGGAFLADGRYYFTDWAGFVRPYDPTTHTVGTDVATGVPAPISLKAGPDGALYLLDYTGEVLRISTVAGDLPRITQAVPNRKVFIGESVTFSAGVAVNQAVADTASYQWQRNGVDIPDATTTTYTFTPTLADSGAVYSLVASTSSGAVTTSGALTIDPDRAPIPYFKSPSISTTYSAGQLISFGFTATDPDQKKVNDSSFAYRILQMDSGTAIKTLVSGSGKTSGTFRLPTTGSPTSTTIYRIELTVTDNSGRQAVITRDLKPKLIRVTFTSSVSGIPITVAGVASTFAKTTFLVQGYNYPIAAPSSFILDDVRFQFTGFSTGTTKKELLFQATAAQTLVTATYKIATAK